MARVLKSGPSRKACYLRFINHTSRKVNVIWIDYAGYCRNYGTLDPNRHFDIHTYEGHPWVCEDSITKTRMLLNKLEIFYPASPKDQPEPNREIRCYLPVLSNNELNRNDGNGIKREYVYITLPVFSLLELSAEVIIKNVRSRGDIRSLEIPTMLKTMLQSLHFHH